MIDKVRILVHKKVQCINNINSILFTKSLSFVDQTERTLGTLTKVIKLNKVIVELQKNICLVDCRIFRISIKLSISTIREEISRSFLSLVWSLAVSRQICVQCSKT